MTTPEIYKMEHAASFRSREKFQSIHDLCESVGSPQFEIHSWSIGTSYDKKFTNTRGVESITEDPSDFIDIRKVYIKII